VDVRDVAEAHVRALEIDAPASRYLCVNRSLWMVQMGRTMKRAFSDHPVPTRQLPDFIAYGSALFNKQVSFGYLRRNLGVERTFDTSRIRRDMTLDFRDIDDTLIDTARSIVEGGWI
jgi:dihydroflavonol-4-reductase